MHSDVVSKYAEDDFLMISGIQHFAFCRRQWALIHVENQWADNAKTTGGQILHRNAHNPDYIESRGDCLIYRDLRVQSAVYGLSGACDVVEFYRSERGITLNKREGLWLPFPVEYKFGEPKTENWDELQLCAEAVCLEEMLCCDIPQGALFYGKTRHRYKVVFDEKLRSELKNTVNEMHAYYQKGVTPKPKPSKRCQACSLKDVCLPEIFRKSSVKSYIEKALAEEDNATIP